jgi:esterase/lipase
MHSKNDATVTPDNMVRINEEIGTPEADKDMVYVEESGHVLTRDIQKEFVFQHIRQFIEKVSTA